MRVHGRVLAAAQLIARMAAFVSAYLVGFVCAFLGAPTPPAAGTLRHRRYRHGFRREEGLVPAALLAALMAALVPSAAVLECGVT